MSPADFLGVEEATARLRGGEMIVLCEREEDGTTGSLVIAAEFADAEAINFMTKEARGLLCLALTDERCQELGLEPMERGQRERVRPLPLTVTIEAATGVTTGISAADRARTIAVAIDPAAGPRELVVPGHVSPLRTARGGVLEAPLLPEAALELASAAGLLPAAAICDVLAEDGASAALSDLSRFARRHELGLLSVTGLLAQRLREGQGKKASPPSLTAGGPR